MPGTRPTTPEQEARALELRERGFTYEEIAQAVGVRRGQAYNAVRHELARQGRAEAQRVRDFAPRPGRTAAAAARAARRNMDVLRAEAVAAVSRTLDIRTRRFGIEIECVRPRGMGGPADAAHILRSAGISAYASNYSDHNAHGARWACKLDGSSDWEIVSPPLSGEDGLQQVITVMAALRAAGCTVSRQEGLHVHVDASDLTRDGIVDLVEYYTVQHDVFDGLVASSRRDSQWCHRLDDGERHAYRNARSLSELPYIDRYRSVNLAPYRRQGTVEFRQHQGSLNGTKATRWVRLLVGLVTAAATGHLAGQYETTTDLDGMLTLLTGLDLLDAGAADGLRRRAADLATTTG